MAHKRAVLVSVTILIAALTTGTMALSQEEPPYETGPNAVPDSLEFSAKTFLEANYEGRVQRVYQQARTTMGYWTKVEGNNAGPEPLSPDEADQVIYSVFVEGDFQTHVPVTASPDYLAELKEKGVTGANFQFARLVLDASGDVLLVQLRQERLLGDPPFGDRLDDE